MLVLQVNELKRSIAVAQKNMPNKRALDNELVTLQIQVGFKRLILTLNLPPRTHFRLSVRFCVPDCLGVRPETELTVGIREPLLG